MADEQSTEDVNESKPVVGVDVDVTKQWLGVVRANGAMLSQDVQERLLDLAVRGVWGMCDTPDVMDVLHKDKVEMFLAIFAGAEDLTVVQAWQFIQWLRLGTQPEKNHAEEVGRALQRMGAALCNGVI